ncbi:EAL domain-containing protein [Amphritea opalescens]|uniref:EAL domain-containing protein n=1 Tax=Amphritea opalescens TaxID=2490544 RepID=A0A430KS56_9GAMM|nr:EAL domain-containing protein [Amphritea opalescens]RTE66300.1 EAL domain-containing protein [Amphritea opalescens]
MRKYDVKKPPSFTKWLYGGLICAISLIGITLWLSFLQSVDERNERSALHARMIQSTITRTFEALEITLISLSDDLRAGNLSPEHINDMHNRALKTLKFAPQLRQITVVKGSNTIIDTHNDANDNINLNILGLNDSYPNPFSLGLMIGTPLKGRFLPKEGYFPEEGSIRSLIPIGFETRAADGDKLLIIATFNPSYFKRYINDLNLEKADSVYLTDFNGNVVLQKGLYGPNRPRVISNIKAALAENADVGNADSSLSPIQFSTISTELLSKYPLAVSVVTDHKHSLILWLKQKNGLIFILFIAIAALSFGTFFLVRTSKSALKMKDEVHLLSQVVEHSPTIIAITDPDGAIEYVNASFENITGYSRDEVIGQNPRVLKSGDTPDNEYEAMWEILVDGGTWTGEFHNKHKDGTLYWEYASISPLINEDGAITHFIALKRPITDEKAAQEKLRLASDVFSSAAEAIMVTDRNSRIQMVNPSFEQITGYQQSEVLGRTPAILKSGKHSEHFYKTVFEELEAKCFWEGEIWNRRKNGELYPQWVVISSRFDPQGDLEGYVALFSDITKRKHNEAVIIHQANYDALTGLPNRNLFEDRLNQAIAFSERSQTKAALLYLDLDRFKYVNDTFGHYTGDLLLQQVAERLQACVRKSDTVARLGGDEFAIIVPELEKLSTIDNIADKALHALSLPYQLDGHEAYISCSIGIAIYPDNGAISEKLVINADNAMYKAKEAGRNTRDYFNEDMNEDSRKRSLLEQNMYKALERGEFYLVYQPIWSTDGQNIESVEALIRWLHPERGTISPLEFIPLAEESALIHSLGEWIIQESCRFVKQLRTCFGEAPVEIPKVSINISSAQFLRGNVADILNRELAALSLNGTDILVEITESALMMDQKRIYSQLDNIVSQGIDIAIDDFGTGYSSLSYLKKYPVKRLKIDKSFIDDLVTDKDDQALVSGIISLANSLSLKTIVEGVETQEQLDILRQYGSPMIQGYLLAKPMTDDLLLDLLKSRLAQV